MGIYMSHGWPEEIPTSTNITVEKEAEATILRYICHTLQLPEVPEFHRQSLIDTVKWHLFSVESAVLKFEGMHVYYLTSSLTESQLIQTAAPTPVVSSPIWLRLPTCPEQLDVLWRAAADRNLSLETFSWRMMAGIDTRIMRVFRTTNGAEVQFIKFCWIEGAYTTENITEEEEEITHKRLIKYLGDKEELIFVGFVEYMSYQY